MVIDNFDIFWSFVRPAESQPPLVVDPNTALTLKVPSQSLETIRWSSGEVGEHRGRIKILKTSLYLLFNSSIPSDGPTLENGLGVLIPKAPDHAWMLEPDIRYVKRTILAGWGGCPGWWYWAGGTAISRWSCIHCRWNHASTSGSSSVGQGWGLRMFYQTCTVVLASNP